MKLIGLTGGMASGKSSVAAYLKERGIPVLDADQLAREVLLAKQVEKLFGKRFIKDGQIDRQQLADFVFAHPKERARLEALTHPLIASKLANALHDLEKEGHPLVVYEASLIFEKNLQDRFAAVILIAAPEDLQIERALSRGGMTRNQVQARIRSQMPTEQKRLLATYVIDNVASKAVLRQQVDLILAKLA